VPLDVSSLLGDGAAEAIRARLAHEAAQVARELDAETAKARPHAYTVGRLRSLLLKLLQQLGRTGAPATRAAKPRSTVGDLTRRIASMPVEDE